MKEAAELEWHRKRMENKSPNINKEVTRKSVLAIISLITILLNLFTDLE